MRKKNLGSENISFFERIHSVPKLLISILIAVVFFMVLKTRRNEMLSNIMIGWDIFSLCMIVMSWITFSVTDSIQIRQQSKFQDSSRTLIFIIVLIANLAGFLAVLLLIVTKKHTVGREPFQLSIAIAGMLLSWILIHTIFTLRYAHIFYGDHETFKDTHAGGLIFPGNNNVDYFDFAYFSFVLGMTFQVSDVQITSKKIRRTALFHGLLSFGFNTIMIALTINLIAGFG